MNAITLHYSNSGQAMIEFVTAILVVVIVITGLLQFFELSDEKEKILEEIRGETGTEAMHGTTQSSVPDYIRSWDEGYDKMRHTADDKNTKGSATATLCGDILDRSVANQTDWTCFAPVTDSDLLAIRQDGTPAAALGFIRKERKEKIDLLPSMKNWIFKKDTISVGSELWMPKLTID